MLNKNFVLLTIMLLVHFCGFRTSSWENFSKTNLVLRSSFRRIMHCGNCIRKFTDEHIQPGTKPWRSVFSIPFLSCLYNSKLVSLFELTFRNLDLLFISHYSISNCSLYAHKCVQCNAVCCIVIYFPFTPPFSPPGR